MRLSGSSCPAMCPHGCVGGGTESWIIAWCWCAVLLSIVFFSFFEIDPFIHIRPNAFSDPIHTGRATRRKANGTCWCEWEYPHCTQATSKGLRSNLRARVPCGQGFNGRKEEQVPAFLRPQSTLDARRKQMEPAVENGHHAKELSGGDVLTWSCSSGSCRWPSGNRRSLPAARAGGTAGRTGSSAVDACCWMTDTDCRSSGTSVQTRIRNSGTSAQVRTSVQTRTGKSEELTNGGRGCPKLGF